MILSPRRFISSELGQRRACPAPGVDAAGRARAWCSCSSPSRRTLSIRRVEPIAGRDRERRAVEVGDGDVVGLDPGRRRGRRARAPGRASRARAGSRARARARRRERRRVARREREPVRVAHGRDDADLELEVRGRGRPASRPRPAARPCGRSTRRRGRTIVNSFTQTVATPRKWPGRCSPSSPSAAPSGSTQVANPGG